MGDNFKIILEAMIDNSSLSNAQKQVAKERLKINADISVEDFAKSKKEIEKQIEALGKNIKSILGNAIDDKQANQWAKQYYDQMIAGAKEATREQEKYVDAMAKGREKAEAMRQAEEKRQQLAQNKVINKNLEEEYKLRVKNENAAKKQAEIDRQRALDFTKSSSERLSSAISKYSYGDTSEAKTLMQQMNRGLSNFGDLSNVEGNIQSLSSVIDKVITDLQESHKIGLQSINEEISAERELQTQRDNFNKKNLNAIDFEIQKREESARSFSSMLQAQMQEEQKFAAKADEIQHLSDSGQYQAQYDTLIAKTNQWTNEQGEARIATAALKQSLDELNQASLAYANNNSVENAQKLSTALEKYDVEAKKVTNDIRTMNATMAKDSAIQKLNQQITEFMAKNPKTVKYFGTELRNMLSQAQVGAEKTNQELDELTASYTRLVNEARKTGKLGNTFFGAMKENIKSFLPWTTGTGLVMGGINIVKDGWSDLKELDSILTEISKTSDMTKESLQELGDGAFDAASKYGRTATDYLTGVQTMSQSGFYGKQGEAMAEQSLLAQAAGDMTAEVANKYIIATNAAYKYNGAVEKLNSVTDGMNMIANRNSVAMTDMAEAMSEAGTVASEYRVSVEDFSAMVGTMEAVTKSGGSEVGNALKSILINLQNVSSDKIVNTLDKANASMTEMVNGTEQLRDPITILRDLAKTFNELDEADPLRAEILTNVAGKYQASKLAALLSNMEMFDKMLVDYSEGAGSAMEEAQKSATNWEGSLKSADNAVKELINSLTDQDALVGAIKLFTGLVNGITEVIDKIGVLTPLLGGVGITAFVRNLG